MMKNKSILALLFLSLIMSCNKGFDKGPKLQEPKYVHSEEVFINKISEGDSINIGFEKNMSNVLGIKSNSRKIVFMINSKVPKSDFTESYLENRNKKIAAISKKEISNMEDFTDLKFIYKTKEDAEIKSEISLD